MSFDVFLQRFAGGEPAQVDGRAVREVLSSVTHRGPDDFGFYAVTLSDGAEVELSAKGLETRASFTGCAFHIRESSDGLMKFMFDIARAGDMVIVPAMEGNPLILVSQQQQNDVPVDLRESFQPVVVGSAGELGAALSGGFEGWAAYREQVLGRSRTKGEA
jgi:hypothetical protein